MRQNIIEINGTRYDANTGTSLGGSTSPRGNVRSTRRVIDGFVRPAGNAARPNLAQPKTVAPKFVIPSAPVTSVKRVMDIPKSRKAHTPGKNVQARQTERPKTLMRHVVKKPEAVNKPTIKVQAPAEIAARPRHTLSKLQKKLSVTNVNATRKARANHIAKSAKVQHFGVPQIAQQHLAALKSPVAILPPVVKPHIHATYVAPAPIVKRAPDDIDIFEAAIAHANSHAHPAPKLKRRHSALRNSLAVIAAFMLIGGFTAYMNMSNIQVKVASMQSGIHAQLPSYKPLGYQMKSVESTKGSVAFSFFAGDSSYKISQEASDWNSQSLFDNFVATNSKTYKTVEQSGRTIYIYDNDNATWVDGGVRYNISGDASLSQNDLVSLATTM